MKLFLAILLTTMTMIWACWIPMYLLDACCRKMWWSAPLGFSIAAIVIVAVVALFTKLKWW